MRALWVAVVFAVIAAACGGGATPETAPVGSRPPGPANPVPVSTSPAPASSDPTPPPTSSSPASVAPGGTVPSPPTTTVSPGDGTIRAGPAPVVDLFYAIHVHAQREWSPFVDPGLAELDVDLAQGFVEHVEAIATTLDAHGARGSFHFTFGTAAGLCRHAPGLFPDLEARGHEIGIHAHTDQFILRAADEMRATCGRQIATGSGLVAMAGGPDAATRARLGTSLQAFEDVGAAQLMVNLSDECGVVSSGGNAGSPWRAMPTDVCADDPVGMLLIDQVSLEYVLTNGAPADIFSDVEFSTLAALAETAIADAATQPRGAVVVWGFVTHTNEYVRGSSPLATPETAALDGLDGLLDRLDPLVAAGLARWSTAAEIAERVG